MKRFLIAALAERKFPRTFLFTLALAGAVSAATVLSTRVLTEDDPANRTEFSRVLRTFDETTLNDGRVLRTARPGSFTEIASGLFYKDTRGDLKLAQVEPALMADGSVAFQKLQRQFAFAPNANLQAVVTTRNADGSEIHSAVAGLAYYDKATGQSAVFASLKSAAVQPFDAGVYYPDAFQGVDADILYKVHKWGMEQDIVVYGNVPPPEWFGIARSNAVFCVLTEIVGLAPAGTAVERPEGASAELPDVGAVRINSRNGGVWQKLEEFHSGYSWVEDGALDVGADSRGTEGKTPVKIRIFTSAGRTFLSEELPFKAVGDLDQLAADPSGRPSRDLAASIPPERPAAQGAAIMTPAVVRGSYEPRSQQRMVLDYATYSSITNAVIFKKGQTYYVSDFMILDTGAKLTVGPGCIVKFKPSASIKFINGARLDCRGNVLDPAIFTTACPNRQIVSPI